jgi:glycerol uptake facilitator-like aquaporin
MKLNFRNLLFLVVVCGELPCRQRSQINRNPPANMVSKWYDVLGAYLHFAGPKVSAYIVEFIGTFFLVLTIGLTVTQESEDGRALAPIAIGSSLMVMIFMGGHISGR